MTLTNADVQHCLDQLVAAEFQNDRWDFSCLSPKGRKPVSDVWFVWAKAEMEACPPVLEIKKQNSPEFRNTVIFYSRLFRVASSYYFFVSENFSMPAYRFLEFSIEIATLHNFIDREKINDQCNRLVSIFCLQNYLLSNERTEPGGGMMDFLRLTPKGRAAFAEWTGTKEPPIESESDKIEAIEKKIQTKKVRFRNFRARMKNL